ncbi:hypothetical protein LTR37_005368 [Vermiconidia calcicola]|uniref:Uncharacterized protein n=1 Tax=Vermiconidia calcicola TaxID=1690605 RepID=A0ACC3NKG0_9PEZI|nr:hypothetical protein LTR37_005368 [Vermiconidia calcicola]
MRSSCRYHEGQSTEGLEQIDHLGVGARAEGEKHLALNYISAKPEEEEARITANVSAVAPILHIMRHGQGYHSVTENGHDIHDPHLTPEGEEQCRKRRETFDRHDNIELLLASPLRRALQTCTITFQPGIERGLRIIALPMAEEASDAPCDTGSEVEVLKKEFPDNIDFDNVKHDWYVHEGEYAFEPKALIARAAKLRRWIKGRPEKEIALVSHGFFNHFSTGDVSENGEQTTPWWGETELRTFTFVDGPAFQGDEAERWTVDGEDGAMIKETEESLERVGERPHGVTKNINRPAERARNLENFKTDQGPLVLN